MRFTYQGKLPKHKPSKRNCRCYRRFVENNHTSRYESVLTQRRWVVYVISKNTDPCTPDLNTVLSFMHGMHINGCLYNGVCAARSALSSIVTIKGYSKQSEHPLSLTIYNRHYL